MPEIIDPVFAKTSQNARFLLSENERFGLVFVKTGSINSGTGQECHSQRELVRRGPCRHLKLHQMGTCTVLSEREEGESPVLEFLNQSMEARNQVGMGLSYWPARLHRLAVLIPWNRFLSSL